MDDSSNEVFYLFIIITISSIVGFITSLFLRSIGINNNLVNGTIIIGFFLFLFLIPCIPQKKIKTYEFSVTIKDKSDCIKLKRFTGDQLEIDVGENIGSISIIDEQKSLIVNKDLKGQELIKFKEENIDEILKNDKIILKLLNKDEVVERIELEIEKNFIEEKVYYNSRS